MTNKVSLTYQNGNQSNEKTLYPSLVPINGYENLIIIIIIHSLICFNQFNNGVLGIGNIITYFCWFSVS